MLIYMKQNKQYHILHIEDSKVNINSFQFIIKKYSSKISVTVMSLINTENDGSKDDIDIKKPIFFRDLQDEIGITIQDLLRNKFDFSLILIDRNMQDHSNTDAIVNLLISKNIKTRIISVSQEKEQSQIYNIEWIEKTCLGEQFEEKIYNTLINMT